MRGYIPKNIVLKIVEKLSKNAELNHYHYVDPFHYLINNLLILFFSCVIHVLAG